MQDPTRIGPTIALLHDVWEARPDLELSEVFGILANRGITWGSTDDQLRETLTELLDEQPVSVTPEHPKLLVTTTSPNYHVSILQSPEKVVVVRQPHKDRQPVTWHFARVKRSRVSGPLVLTDLDGHDHRLGVVTGMRPIKTRASGLNGLQRHNLRDRRYVLRLADDKVVVIGTRMVTYGKNRRNLSISDMGWDVINQAKVGEELLVTVTYAVRPMELGTVSAIYAVE